MPVLTALPVAPTQAPEEFRVLGLGCSDPKKIDTGKHHRMRAGDACPIRRGDDPQQGDGGAPRTGSPVSANATEHAFGVQCNRRRTEVLPDMTKRFREQSVGAAAPVAVGRNRRLLAF